MEPEVERVTGVSAIAAAVENRLAEAGLGSCAPSLAERAEENKIESAAAAPVSNETSSMAQEVAPAPIAALQPVEVAQTESHGCERLKRSRENLRPQLPRKRRWMRVQLRPLRMR